jgi:multiple sugar transport system permease protein
VSARRVATGLGAAAIALFCLAPFAWLVLASVRPEAELARLAPPAHPTLARYRAVFASQPFARVLANSLVAAGGTTVTSIALGAPAAFALAKLRVPGERLVLGAALAVSMFPPIATVSPLYLLLRRLGLLDSVVGLVVPYSVFGLPLTIWVLTGFFRALPDELYRAARVDGCTPVGALGRVMLPLVAPGLATTAILAFIAAYSELLYALTFLSSPEKRTVPVAIALFAGEHEEPWGEIAAAAAVTTLPLVAVAVLFQRRIVAGLTAGAVKG